MANRVASARNPNTGAAPTPGTYQFQKSWLNVWYDSPWRLIHCSRCLGIELTTHFQSPTVPGNGSLLATAITHPRFAGRPTNGGRDGSKGALGEFDVIIGLGELPGGT